MIPTDNHAYRRAYAIYDAACLQLVDAINDGVPARLDAAAQHWRTTRGRLLDVMAEIDEDDCD